MSGVLPCRRPLKVLLSCFPFLFSMGCVTTGSDGTTRSIKQNPELIVSANWRHNGTGDSAADRRGRRTGLQPWIRRRRNATASG